MENKEVEHIHLRKHTWRKANPILFICGVIFVGGILISSDYGDVRKGGFDHKLTAFVGVLLFTIFASIFLRILAGAIRNTIIYSKLGNGRANALEFIILIAGYLTILITALDHLGVPVAKILLGSAVLGIILGVAAQQALANIFASIVLIISHPFIVGEKVTFNSGAMGGKYEGKVIDIGLTHTYIEEKDGTIVLLPNSTLLASTSVRKTKKTS